MTHNKALPIDSGILRCVIVPFWKGRGVGTSTHMHMSYTIILTENGTWNIIEDFPLYSLNLTILSFLGSQILLFLPSSLTFWNILRALVLVSDSFNGIIVFFGNVRLKYPDEYQISHSRKILVITKSQLAVRKKIQIRSVAELIR